MQKSFVAGLAIFAALGSGAALAADGALTLVIGGEAYDGAPKFEVSFGGQVIGEGVVDAAIDTVSGGRFTDALVKSAHVQTFEFKIPEAQFRPDGEVRLKFLNEAYGGDGSNRDRNLYVYSVAVNGKEVPGATLTTLSETGLEPSAVLGEFLVLADGTADAVSLAPDEGWPEAGVEVAAAPAVVEPKVEAPAAVTAEIAAPVAVEPKVEAVPEVEVAAVPMAKPAARVVEVAAVPVVKAPAPEAEVAAAPAVEAAHSTDPVQTASIAGPPVEEAADACGLDQLYNVIGFNENSNDLTPRLQERLDQILADIGNRECVVQVVGYSSTVGDNATNALFAVERAQNVLRYLREAGLKVAEATATGAGETEQFGSDPLKNRRVVITVSP